MEKEFEESFEEVYQKVVSTSTGRLKEVKNKNNKFVLVVLAVLLVINLIIFINADTRKLISLSASISVCVLLIFIISGNGNYRRIYKECVIEGLVKGYNEKFYYDAKTGITRTEYNLSHFDDKYNEYRAEDRIFGTLESGDNFQISEVSTMEVKRTKDSSERIREEKTETFRGMYGIVRLQKNTLTNIHIASNNNMKRFVKNRVEVDSGEFEKYYDCLTNDRIEALRIFTADLIEKYIEIVRDNKYGFELKIVDNMIFLRYRTKQLFEPPMFKLGLDKEFLKKNYKVIYYPLEIMKLTVENINQVFE